MFVCICVCVCLCLCVCVFVCLCVQAWSTVRNLMAHLVVLFSLSLFTSVVDVEQDVVCLCTDAGLDSYGCTLSSQINRDGGGWRWGGGQDDQGGPTYI